MPRGVRIMAKPSVLGFYCCHNRAHTGWLKTREIYCLAVLEAISSKLRCWQGHTSCKTVGEENVSLPLSSFWWFAHNLWYSLACNCTTPISAFIVTWHSFCRLWVFRSSLSYMEGYLSY